jgi:hypothetical protein
MEEEIGLESIRPEDRGRELSRSSLLGPSLSSVRCEMMQQGGERFVLGYISKTTESWETNARSNLVRSQLLFYSISNINKYLLGIQKRDTGHKWVYCV